MANNNESNLPRFQWGEVICNQPRCNHQGCGKRAAQPYFKPGDVESWGMYCAEHLAAHFGKSPENPPE